VFGRPLARMEIVRALAQRTQKDFWLVSENRPFHSLLHRVLCGWRTISPNTGFSGPASIEEIGILASKIDDSQMNTMRTALGGWRRQTLVVSQLTMNDSGGSTCIVRLRTQSNRLLGPIAVLIVLVRISDFVDFE